MKRNSIVGRIRTLVLAGCLSVGAAAWGQQYNLMELTNQVWRFDQTNDQYTATGTGWTESTFDDSSWQEGKALLSSDGNAVILPLRNTVLRDFRQRTPPNPALYARSHFQWPGSSGNANAILLLNIRVDDGCAVYLNGHLVAALRIDTNVPVTHATFSTALVPCTDNDATCDELVTLNGTYLLNGDNVLAVSVHQNNSTSSDVTWGCRLDGIIPFTPAIVDANQPSNRIVLQHRVSTLSVVYTASPPVTVQWFFQPGTNGGVFNPILNATNAAYTITDMSVANEGLYYAVVGNPLGSVNSRTATVRYTEDSTPPTVLAVRPTADPTKIIVQYSEVVVSNSAVDLFNYGSPAGYPAFAPVAAVLDAAGSSVLLTLDTPLPWDSQAALRVTSQSDLAGNTLDEVVVVFQTSRIIRGFGLEQLYLNIGNGVNVGDLLGNAKYPDFPDITEYRGLLEGPVDFAENYGTRISGWLVPPVSGNYNFWMSSDDAGEFWLSTDDTAPSLARIAYEPQYNGSRDYYTTARRNATAPENASSSLFPAGIPLTAGQRYFFQLLQKEGGGGDNSSVAWQIPGQPRPTSPIGGVHMATAFDPLLATSLIITQQPRDVVAVQPPPVIPRPLLSANFAANNGGFSVSNVVLAGYDLPAGPWNYNAAAGSWTNFGTEPCGSPKGSALLSPRLMVPGVGGVTVTFVHRYSWEYDGTTFWDGGQVRLSVNGGPFRPVTNFFGSGYNATVTGAGLINNQRAFADISPGYATGQFITNTAALGNFAANDEIVVQFLASWDECTTRDAPSWEIKNVEVTFGVAVPLTAQFTVAASSVVGGAPSTSFSYQWQRDGGAGFEDILDAYDQTYARNVALADSGTKFRCITYGLGSVATSEVATLTVTLPVQISRDASSVTIAWPPPATGFLLERSTTLSGNPPPWVVVPGNSYQTNAVSIYYRDLAPTANQFYRLRRQ